MLLTDRVVMRGDPDRIYALAADVERWPALLPHYRYVVVEQRSNDGVVARMGATRSGLPVGWRARQVVRPGERRVLFTHVGGITRGMEVEWRIEPTGDGVVVTITHDLVYRVPVLGPLFARWIVGELFIHHIAGRTLRCIQQKVEAEAVAAGVSS